MGQVAVDLRFRLFGKIHAHGVLEAAETELESLRVQVGPRKVQKTGITFAGQPVDDGTAGVPYPHQPGYLVEGLAGRVIAGIAQDMVRAPPLDVHQLRVSAGYDKRDERRVEFPVRQSPREHVAFNVIYADQGLVHRQRDGLDRSKSDQQAARETRSVGHGEGVQAVRFTGSLAQGRFDRGQEKGKVRPGGQFRNDPPVFMMYALR